MLTKEEIRTAAEFVAAQETRGFNLIGPQSREIFIQYWIDTLTEAFGQGQP